MDDLLGLLGANRGRRRAELFLQLLKVLHAVGVDVQLVVVHLAKLDRLKDKKFIL